LSTIKRRMRDAICLQGEIAMSPDSELLKVIASIYDAALEPERWPVALEHIAGLLGAMHAHLWEGDASQRLGSVAWAGAAPAFVQAYEEHYVCTDPFALARTWPSGTMLTDDMATPRAALERSDFFQEWARPQGMHTAIGANVAVEDGTVAVLVATRTKHDETFGREQFDLLAEVLPHLQRAMRINLYLSGASGSRHVACAALNALSHGVVIVDAACRVIFANRAAEQTLTASDGIGSGPAGLFAMTVTLTNRLRALVTQASGTGGGPPTGGALLLGRRSMMRPYHALISPMCTDIGLGALASRRPAAMILLVDPEREPVSLEQRLRTLYHLTAAEARVACEIHRGTSLSAIAELLDVRASTVRTHLHHIFEKTGTRRQSELARQIEQMTVVLPST